MIDGCLEVPLTLHGKRDRIYAGTGTNVKWDQMMQAWDGQLCPAGVSFIYCTAWASQVSEAKYGKVPALSEVPNFWHYGHSSHFVLIHI